MNQQSNLNIDLMEPDGTRAARRPWVRLVAQVVTFLYLTQIIGPVASAFAQVVAYKNAPAGRRPIMDAANNGVPIVNIAPPSAGGVSHNQYQDLNVNPQGLILNNSRNNNQTQLGGWIAGNPQMGATPARVILNEVVSGNPSQLRGTIEVAGQKAAIVIANPNGVTCDGCGFLNTDRATLAAGTPQFGSGGALTGFNIGQGQLNIGEKGLSAANVEQLDLIARGIVIEGEVWSRNLNVIAGRNDVLYGTLQAIAKSGSGSTPGFAIDIKELGGMYANQIYMVATEQGLGVNSTGRIAALQGNLTLSVNGDLALTNSYAKQNLQIAANGNVALKDKTIGDGAVRVAAIGNLDNLGIVFSGGDLEMKAAHLTDNKGKLMAARDLSMQAGAITLNETTITADGNAMLAASTGNVEADKVQLYAGGNLDIAAADRIVNAGGAWQAVGNASLQARNIENRTGGIFASQALSLTTANGGLLDNQAGTLVGNTAVALNGSAINNAQGTIATDGTLHVDTKGAQLDNTDGNIQSGADTTVAALLDNTGGTLAAAGNLTLDIGDDYTNRGVLSSDKDLTVNATNIANSGTMNAGNRLIANTGDLVNDGEISAVSETALNLSGTLTNTATGLIDGSKTTVDAHTIDNTGRVYGDVLKVQVDTLNNSDTGVVAARENMLLGARSIANTNGGLIYSQGDIAMARSFDTDGHAVGEVETVLNASAKIEAAGNIAIAAGDLINRNDELVTQTVTSSTPITKTQIQRYESSDLTKYDPSELGWSAQLGRKKGAYVLPSTKYPFATYGTEPKAKSLVWNCDSDNGNCTGELNYAVTDPIWALMGVAPPKNSDLLPQALTTDQWSCQNYAPNVCRDYETWQQRLQTQGALLDSKINAFNTDLTNRSFDDWYQFTWTSKNVTDTVVASSRPAEILAGKALTIDASRSVLNDNSNIVAGGAISIVGASVENRGKQGTRTETDVGTYRIRYVTRTTNKPKLEWYDQGAITGAPVVTTTTLQAYTYKQNASAPVATRDLTSNAGSTPTTPLSDEAIDQLNGQTQYRDLTIPDSSLFKPAAPGATYLVETDPRFTNKKNFLSSDYYLDKLGGNPDLQLKRYGDGFVEQQMVNDQILALTGRRYLSGYTSTEDEYKGLMDAGIAFAQEYQISPGVALSAEQMALLTTDIVLLIKQSVTLPDGSVQEVLVPQVYLRRPQEGDLRPNGGLIAGSDVTIRSAGDIVNSGQISANNETTLLAGNDLINRDGRISGQDVYARANNDLKNISGTILGTGEDSKVALSAGRDIVLETRTIAGATAKSATTVASTRVNVDHIATVQGGDVTLDAGRDMIGKASAVLADNDLAVVAGRDIKVSAAETSYAINEERGGRVTQGRTGHFKEESVTNELAVFGAGGNIVLAAGTAGKGDLTLTGVNAAAGDSLVMQGTNVTVEAVKDSQLADIQNVSKNYYSRYMRADETLSGGVISAGNDLIIRATGEAGAADANGVMKAIAGTGDVKLSGAYLQSQNGQVGVIANNNVEIGAIKTEHSTAYEYYKKSKSMFSTKVVTISDLATHEKAEGSVINGKSVAIQAGNQVDMVGDVIIKASQIVADNDLQISAGRNLNIDGEQQTSQTSYFYEKKKSGFLSKSKKAQRVETRDTQSVGSALVGNDVTLNGGRDVTILGSNINAANAMIIAAGQDVSIATGTGSHATSEISEVRKSGFSASFQSGISVGSSKGKQTLDRQATSVTSSTVSGSDVLIASTRDTNVVGSNVLADNDIVIKAGRNINIAAAQQGEAMQSTSKSSSNSIGLMPSFINGSMTIYGSNSALQNGQSTAQNAVTSLLSANGGNLTMTAGGANTTDSTITTQGADLLAGKTVTLEADRIDLQAAANSTSASNHAESKSFTVGSQPAGVLGSLVYGITQNLMNAAEGTGNNRLDGAMALKAGYDTYKAMGNMTGIVNDVQKAAADGITNPSQSSLFGVSFTVGSSKSSSDSSNAATQVTGTNVQAQNIDITARKTDIEMEGAKLQAENIDLTAARDVILKAAANISETHSKNKSSSASVGATIGLGQQSGISFQLGMQEGKGKANGNEVTYDNTLITATDTLNVKSGNDTTLQGAQLAGNQVMMDVGNDLTIQTLQDSSKYKSEQKNGGFGLSLCIPPLCVGTSSASVNMSEQSIKHNYQSAQGQSGIAAGDGGFDITVNKHTDLTGAAITSTADKEKNQLTTGSLSSSDLTNIQDTKAKSSSFSGGVSMGGGASVAGDLSQFANDSALNLAGNAAAQKELPKSGNEQSQTVSVISPATVTITGTDQGQNAQSQQTAELLTSRDAATANQALDNTLTLQQAAEVERALQKAAQADQAARMMGQLGQQLANDIGTYAGKKELELRSQAAGQTDPAKQAELNAEADKWAEGGLYRVGMHAALGALTGGADGALGAAASAGVVPEIGKIVKDLDIPVEAKQAMVLLAGTAAGSIGGAAGAATGLNQTNNNYLKHDEVLEKAAKDKACKGGDDSACKRVKELEIISDKRNLALQDACSSGPNSTCNALMAEARQAAIENWELVAKPALKGESEIDAQQKVDAYRAQAQYLNALDMLVRNAGVSTSPDQWGDVLTPQQASDLAEFRSNNAQIVAANIAGAIVEGAVSKIRSQGGKNIGGRTNGGENNGADAGFDTSNLKSKLEGYLLDSTHPQNQAKANWFQQALGFDKNNWQDLASQIKFNEATAIPTKSTQYGQTFEQSIPITGANGKTIDTTFVFMKDASGVVRLVTGIPTKK